MWGEVESCIFTNARRDEELSDGWRRQNVLGLGSSRSCITHSVCLSHAAIGSRRPRPELGSLPTCVTASPVWPYRIDTLTPVHHHGSHRQIKMAANFAPYQDIPETQRALSPPLASPRTSVDRTRNISSIASPSTRAYEQHDYFGAGDDSPDTERIAWDTPAPSQPLGFGTAREDVDMFTTSLGLRMDYEACLAYLLLPPAGGVLLLVLEHQSDYVRFHAWQSSLLFAFMFVVHIIFSWSSFISWVLFAGDVGLIGFLTWRAYLDGEWKSALKERIRADLEQRRHLIDTKFHSSDH